MRIQWLAKKLSELGHLKGFEVIKVNPYGTSTQCPLCGYSEDADVVGAVNIKLRTERVAREPYVPLTSLGTLGTGTLAVMYSFSRGKFFRKEAIIPC